jgi:hypothetical protein
MSSSAFVADAAPLASVISVTGVWALMYYFFLQLGPSAALTGKAAGQVEWGRRAFGNLHEQSVIFLPALWLHALFTSVPEAALMGWTYLAFRALYPIVWAIGGGFTQKVFISTLPQYGIVIYMLAVPVAQASFGVDLKAMVMGSNALGCFIGFVAFFTLFQLNANVTQKIVENFFVKSEKSGKSK